jgi:hypothetical protein
MNRKRWLMSSAPADVDDAPLALLEHKRKDGADGAQIRKIFALIDGKLIFIAELKKVAELGQGSAVDQQVNATEFSMDRARSCVHRLSLSNVKSQGLHRAAR